MAVRTVTNLVMALQQHQLLEPSRQDMVSRSFQGKFADAAGLAAELLRLGWLTKYQTDLVLEGRGDQLVLGPFRIVDLLGEGGVSRVFKAWHVPYQCLVALKVLRPEVRTDAEALRQFQQELKVVGKLAHPNIVKGIDIHPERGDYYFALEYVEGTDLGKMVQQGGALPVAQACEYIRQAALALQHAYERGVIHRDIKPANLLITNFRPPQSVGVLKVLDMGLARREWLTDPTAAANIAPVTMVLGTPDFVAPEQATSPELVDIRADIYSLGCTLYFLLTAKPPFPGRSLAQKLMGHQKGEATPLEQVRADVPQRLPAVIRKMMAKKPEDRFRTPASVAAALSPFARGDAS
jgi:eukaryotic-like serine/threonine-protein kinase